MNEHVDVALRLTSGSDVPSGEIAVSGESVEFYGWLALLSALERARRTPTAAEQPPQ